MSFFTGQLATPLSRLGRLQAAGIPFPLPVPVRATLGGDDAPRHTQYHPGYDPARTRRRLDEDRLLEIRARNAYRALHGLPSIPLDLDRDMPLHIFAPENMTVSERKAVAARDRLDVEQIIAALTRLV